MANSKSQFVLSSADAISKACSQIDQIDGQVNKLRADNANAKTEAIMEVYNLLITDLAQSGVKLIKRGKEKGLPVAVMTAITEQFTQAGVATHNVKRFKENTNKLLRVMPELLDCKDFGAVALTMHNEGLVSQAAITKKVKGLDAADPLDALAKKLFALSDDELQSVYDKLANLKRDAEKKAKADADIEVVEDVVNALDAA